LVAALAKLVFESVKLSHAGSLGVLGARALAGRSDEPLDSRALVIGEARQQDGEFAAMGRREQRANLGDGKFVSWCHAPAFRSERSNERGFAETGLARGCLDCRRHDGDGPHPA
jgi:hypothetical protein